MKINKINFVSVDNGIITIGFRKMSSLARTIHPNVVVNFVVPVSLYSPLNIIFNPSAIDKDFQESEVDAIAKHLAEADMVCFSSMTPFAKLTKRIINKIRLIAPETYIEWGGVHPIVYPEDAIQYADAICIGEGETAFRELIRSLTSGDDFTKTKNFWFNINGKIIKNGFLPLHSPDDMEKLPFPLYADDELLYKKGVGFVQCGVNEYLSLNNLAYSTVWSIGCPFKCIYCSNSKFIENDKNYRKLRYPSVDYIISEVNNALRKHPHISTVVFHDDSFMAIPLETLKEFAVKWKLKIALPFVISGLTPSYVRKDKMSLLVSAGMNRVRMGIQSGSNRMLKFYNRPNRLLIDNAVSIIANFSQYMMPPVYDIIVDNPVEECQDIIDTLEMIYNLPRPFMLNIYSLRVIPNTKLSHELSRLGISIPSISENYFITAPTIANILIYLMVVIKPHRIIQDILMKYAKPVTQKQRRFPLLMFLVRTAYYIKRGYDHLKILDFSVLQGKIGFLLYKIGVIRFYQNKKMHKLTHRPLGKGL